MRQPPSPCGASRHRRGRRPTPQPCSPHAAGFAYLLLLLAVALLALSATAALQLSAQTGRREAELALQAIGDEFERALYSYAALSMTTGINTSAGALTARGPRALEELVKDPRVPGIRRHLRRVYADPLTGRNEWGLVRDNAGFIIGIHSLSQDRPFKQFGFDFRHAHFEQASSYARWVYGLPMAQLRAMQGATVPTSPAGASTPLPAASAAPTTGKP